MDAHFFERILREVYGIDAMRMEALPESDIQAGASAYRVECLHGSVVILRAYRDDHQPPEDFRYFYPWTCTDTVCDMSIWLWTRAETLGFLEQAGYAAPRAIETRLGGLIGQAQDWTLLVTSYVQGDVLRPTHAQLRALGEAVGRLHALPLEPSSGGYLPGPSYWPPDYAIASALGKLVAVENILPSSWQSLYNGLRSSVEGVQRAIQRGELLEGMIHGDVWAANAVEPEEGRAVLIDWSQGGLGVPVLDLGRLLLECHLDADLPPDEPLAWHIRPDPARIAAVVDGYAHARTPSGAELDLLLDATRFGIAFIGALHFAQALLRPRDDPAWRHGMQRRFARLANRFAVSEEVAAVAQARLGEQSRSRAEAER